MKIISVLLIVLALPAIYCVGQHTTPIPVKGMMYAKPVQSTLAKLLPLQPQEFAYIGYKEPSQPKFSYITTDIERIDPPFTTQQAMPSLDQFYIDIRKAYQNLDTAQLSSLYFESAQYLNFSGRIAEGKTAFMPGIGIYFNQLKRQGQQLDILFQLEKRHISKSGDMAYDVGYFLYIVTKDGKEERSAGKFVNIFHQENGQWKLMVDMVSGAPLDVFTSTQTLFKHFTWQDL
jgi:ketosteroid isomerase-like protein